MTPIPKNKTESPGEEFVVSKLSFLDGQVTQIIGPLLDYEEAAMNYARAVLLKEVGLEFADMEYYELFDAQKRPSRHALVDDIDGNKMMNGTDLNSYPFHALFESYCEIIRTLKVQDILETNPYGDPTPEVNSLIGKIKKLLDKKVDVYPRMESLLEHLVFFNIYLAVIKRTMKKSGRGSPWLPENWFIRKAAKFQLLDSVGNVSYFTERQIILVLVALGIWLPVGAEISVEDIIGAKQPAVHKTITRDKPGYSDQIDRFVSKAWSDMLKIRTQFIKKS